jgi:hypothetical protein
LLCSSLTSVSEMGDTKPIGRGLWGWVDIVENCAKDRDGR